MKRINLVQAGFGLIGTAVAEQVLANRAMWAEAYGLDVRITGICSSRGIIGLAAEGIDSEQITALIASRRAGDLIAPVDGRPILDQAIVLDAAAGTGTTALAKSALAAGGAVVYSNKAPLSQATTEVADLWSAARSGLVRYETTCGAGLPVISTVKSLLATGDEVIEIVGCLSGTLGAIFSSIAEGAPMSQAVLDAKAAGYTEPDPRDDLSGLDVARKALILARTIGRSVDLSDIAVESLVPADLAAGSVADFLTGISAHDQAMGKRQQDALATGSTLKYVATIPATGAINVGIQPVPTSTVLGALQGPENIISIRTTRYDRYPLTISGPGAGAAVTAAGMIADMLDLARGRFPS
ncbi:MAG TPA: hypothetical protein PK819_07230 [Thermomicrobiales bacterium]|nr:hypothetical protein [Thermomicrobiales bacterium]